MKLERNGIVAIAFGVTFAFLLLFNLLTSGFRLEIKGLFVAIYFAIWVGAVSFVILTFIIPFLKERKKTGKKSKTGAGTAAVSPSIPFKSPRSGLPVRERIIAYVAERRHEEGLPAPEPLTPSRPPSSGAGTAFSSVAGAPSHERVSKGPAAPAIAGSGGSDLGDLPLPDGFGSVDESGDMGALPGLDDDLGGLDEFGVGDEMPADFGDDNSGLLGDEGGLASEETVPEPSSDSISEGGLPGFEGDLDSEIGESDIMGDEGVMDLSGDDLLTMDEDSSLPAESEGGLSEAGLPDLDEDLEPDMMESDLSGDEDFGDIEFMDLEPEEPKKPSKK